MEKKIGKDLKLYRERSGLSQGEAELTLELSTGSLSRFENNKVNPSKETLVKLIDLYNVSALEAADLFNINIIESYSNIINYTKYLIENDDLETKIQILIDNFSKELNLMCITLCLISRSKEGCYAYPYSFTNTWYTKLVKKIFGRQLRSFKYYLDATPERDPYIVDTIKTQKIIESDYPERFISPPLELGKAKLCVKITNNRTSICYPLIHENKSIGAILFSSSQEVNWDERAKALESISELFKSLIYKEREFFKICSYE